MKNGLLKFNSLFLFVVLVCQIPAVIASCIDFMIPGEFPPEIITEDGTKLTFSYQFGDNETYSYSWAKGSLNGGSTGPNSLQPSCKIPQIAHENSEFLILENGCGTFCWYFEILGLYPIGPSNIATYQIIYRPLAFDSDRNLIAYYQDKDLIGIKNLLSGYEQIFKTENLCESWSGLCFSDVTFTSDSLSYKWESQTGVGPGKVLIQQLDEGLFRNE